MTKSIMELFNLYKGENDKQKTLDTVKGNIYFAGSNLWILACAIIVASIGLNVNSTAVIIGAMLISPLMGPIIGAGFALGIYDFRLLKKSLLNLLIATIAGLLVSAIYFSLSPFKEVQSELLARTSPNIYDVFIAFFGGLVGVIAITRVEKGNTISGVAIATALMPPLCTAGYGLATENWKYFLGALFLYSINCVFICIATFSIVKYLKYPALKQIDVKHQKQVKYGIVIIILLMLLPSTYFALSLYKQQKFKQLADSFIKKELIANGSIIIFKRINYTATPKTIELAFLKKSYSENEIRLLKEKLKNYGLSSAKLIIKQNSSDNLNNLKHDILNEVNQKDLILNEKDNQIEQLEKELAKNKFDSKQLFKEVNVLFPSIYSTSISNHNFSTVNDSIVFKTVFIYQANPKLNKADKIKLTNWLQKRLSITNLEVINKEQ